MKNLFSRKDFAKSISTKIEEPASVTSLAISPQTHLEKYLAYYVSQLKPGYAVLVTGEWGAGKTYQVRHALPDTHAHYISLFGLNTPNEIEAQIFTKMFPRASAAKRFAEKMDSTSLDIPILGSLATGGLASILTGPFIKNEVDSSRPLILDDLERCAVENDVLLGIINRYVEHHGCRVIVIAHDTQVDEGFANTKEKVFGQTIHVEPNVEAAFAEFVAFFKNPDKPDKLDAHRREVLTTYSESGIASLRILRHVVEDVGRLANALEDRHFENDMAMVELIRLFSALAVEARTNQLEREDIFQRKQKINSISVQKELRKNKDSEKPGIFYSAKKYKSIDIGSTLLSDEVLNEMLFDGRFTEENIRNSLNNSAYFIKKEAAPPWRIVCNFQKLDDKDSDTALTRMNEQFDKREVTDSGEFLHIVALKMMLASRRVLSVTAEQIAKDAKQYIDDLVAAKRLPPRRAGSRWTDDFNDASGGVMYWVEDSYRNDFDGVLDYLISARTKALTYSLPEMSSSLLKVVKRDGQKFFDMVCYSRESTLEYQDIPIFHYVDSTAFVDAWLESPKAGWSWIASALEERYNMLNRVPALASEREWYPNVHKEMLQRAQKYEGLARVRIERAAELMGLPVNTQAIDPSLSYSSSKNDNDRCDY